MTPTHVLRIERRMDTHINHLPSMSLILMHPLKVQWSKLPMVVLILHIRDINSGMCESWGTNGKENPILKLGRQTSKRVSNATWRILTMKTPLLWSVEVAILARKQTANL